MSNRERIGAWIDALKQFHSNPNAHALWPDGSKKIDTYIARNAKVGMLQL